MNTRFAVAVAVTLMGLAAPGLAQSLLTPPNQGQARDAGAVAAWPLSWDAQACDSAPMVSAPTEGSNAAFQPQARPPRAACVPLQALAVAPVPEPPSAVLAAAGLGVIALVVRRRMSRRRGP